MSITQLQLEARRIAGEAIAQMKGQIEKTHDFYQVRSQSSASTYKVTPTGEGWFCSCPDFTVRGVPACKHIFAVQFSLKIRETELNRENMLASRDPAYGKVGARAEPAFSGRRNLVG